MNNKFTKLVIGFTLLAQLQSVAHAKSMGEVKFQGKVPHAKSLIDIEASNKDVLLKVLNGSVVLTPEQVILEDEGQTLKRNIEIGEGDFLTVLGEADDQDGSKLLRVGLVDEGTNDIGTFFVKQNQLANLNVMRVTNDQMIAELATEGRDDDMTPIEELLSAYNDAGNEDLNVTDFTKRHHGKRSSKALNGGKGHRKGMTYCLQNVRLTMGAMNLCHSGSFGEAAVNAVNKIVKQCHYKIVSLSKNPKIGTVCSSWAGKGNKHHCKESPNGICGDAQMYKGHGRWYGWRYSNSPVLRGHWLRNCAEPIG